MAGHETSSYAMRAWLGTRDTRAMQFWLTRESKCNLHDIHYQTVDENYPIEIIGELASRELL